MTRSRERIAGDPGHGGGGGAQPKGNGTTRRDWALGRHGAHGGRDLELSQSSCSELGCPPSWSKLPGSFPRGSSVFSRYVCVASVLIFPRERDRGGYLSRLFRRSCLSCDAPARCVLGSLAFATRQQGARKARQGAAQQIVAGWGLRGAALSLCGIAGQGTREEAQGTFYPS